MDARAPGATPPWHLDASLRRCEILGAEWSYIDTGGARPGLVLLPGSVGTCEVFFKQIAALSGAYRVVAATYPDSSDAGALADGLAGLLEARGLGGAMIAGSSFAAYWLQIFAYRHPTRVGTLVLANGFVDPTPLRAHPLFDPELIAATPETLQRAWHARVATGPSSELRDLQLDMLSGRQPASVLQSRLRGVLDAAPPPPLAITDTRLVILDCDDDMIVTAPMRDALAARYPGARRCSLAHGGHYPHILNPDRYNDVLRSSLTPT